MHRRGGQIATTAFMSTYIFKTAIVYRSNLEEDHPEHSVILPHSIVLDGNRDVRLPPVPNESFRPRIEHRGTCDGFNTSLINLQQNQNKTRS